MMKVLRSMKETPSVFSAAWNTTEHSGGLVLLSTPQRNLHAGLAIFFLKLAPWPRFLADLIQSTGDFEHHPQEAER